MKAVLCLSLAVLFCASSAYAATVSSSDFHLDEYLRRQAMVETGSTTHTEEPKQWFHLDDYLANPNAAHTTAHGMGAGSDVALLQQSEDDKADLGSGSGSASEGDSEDEDASSKEGNSDDAVEKEKTGGSTSVITNRNFMSIMEDAKGQQLSPHLAAAEAQLEAKEAQAKRHGEQHKKGTGEEKEKYERKKKEADEQKQKEKEKEAALKKTQEEVKKAQEGAAKTNARTQEQAKKRKEAEQNHKKTRLVLHKNWRAYGYGWETPRVTRWGSLCVVEGLLRGRNGFIGHLPKTCRPGARIMFSQYNGGHVARVDVLHDGRMYFITGPAQGWLSLDGMTFSVSHNSRVSLGWGWRSYGYGWRNTYVRNQHNFCVLSGLIRSGRWGYFGRVPSSCYPRYGRLIYSACNHKHVTRIDVLKNGYFVYSGGHRYHGWVALDGMAWARTNTKTLQLLNGWRDYGGSFQGARYARIGSICTVSGLVRNSHWKSHIATLPSGCRPQRRLIFACNVHHRSARVDILANGRIVYVNGKSSASWISLSGIKFIARR